VRADVERDDLQGDVGQVCDLQQVFQLGAHHGRAVRGPAQRRLVQHGPQLGGVGLDEELLALHPEADPPFDLLSGGVGVGDEDDGTGVVLGLHEAVDELHLIGADDRGSLFQPDVELEPSGQDVAVLLPPVRGAGRAGQGQQLLAFRLVGDPVQAEQVGHIARPGGAAPPLQSADLGVSGAYRLGGLRGGEVAGFPQPPQLRAQRDPQHGRPATRAGERTDAKCAGKRAGGLALPILTRDHRRSLRPHLAVPNAPSVPPSGPRCYRKAVSRRSSGRPGAARPGWGSGRRTPSA
jgi:hypothetical protein